MLKKLFCFLAALLLSAGLPAAEETVKNELKMTSSPKERQSACAEKKSGCTGSVKSTCSPQKTEVDSATKTTATKNKAVLADNVSQEGFGFPSEEVSWRRGPGKSWYVDFNKAIRKARNEKKRLFVLVTGSDWCGACIKLKNTVLGSKKFKKAADDNFVLVYVDFPHRKPLPESQKINNRMVAQKINTTGYFPWVSIVDPFSLKTIGQIGGVVPVEEYVEKMLAFAPKAK